VGVDGAHVPDHVGQLWLVRPGSVVPASSDHDPHPDREGPPSFGRVPRRGDHCAILEAVNQEGTLVTYVIAEPCVDVKDKGCIGECPVDCIYEGRRSLYIHPDECVDCGACELACPVEAIYYEDDLPEQWSGYLAANTEFFSSVGSPGGAARIGPLSHDHPVIAALPLRVHGE
jgi:NAD-dependent dihydropyrimidine dehydrogenase PreA subunit